MLRALLLLAIRLYWWLVPPRRRRTCLFRISCSCHVYEQTSEGGFLVGLRALVRRWRQCRPGYRFLLGVSAMQVRLADGSIVDASALATSEPCVERRMLATVQADDAKPIRAGRPSKDGSLGA